MKWIHRTLTLWTSAGCEVPYSVFLIKEYIREQSYYKCININDSQVNPKCIGVIYSM